MYELKTKPSDKDPIQIIRAIPNEKKQADAKTLLKLFEKATGRPPVVWGEKIIGFGLFRYTYATGHSGEIYATGFSVTKRGITLHLFLDDPVLQDYRMRLGKSTAGKSCLYINKLSDVNQNVLEEMLKEAWNKEIEMGNVEGERSRDSR